MTQLPPYLADRHRRALAAGVWVVEQIEATIHQLEHLKAVHLASLSRIATRIARDEGHADHGEHVHRAVEAEVAVATRTPQATVASQMGHADALLGGYPELGRVFSEGRVSLRHTEVVVDAGQIVADEAARAAYEAAVVPLALTMTPSQLRAHARRLAEHHAERGIDERHREARQRRGVRIVDLDDGMAQLVATLGAVEAYAIKDRLARFAHEARKRGKGDPSMPEGTPERTPHQTQADVFVDLLLRAGLDTAGGIGPAAGPVGRVQVTVPMFTLAGVSRDEAAPFAGPAELEGYGPIDTETARRLAGATSGWDRVMTHPISGAVLAVDRYRPGEDLRRALGARDQHCRFPGCARRLDHCDIDHTVPAAKGGPTSPENTGHLCRRHHTLKHFDFLGGGGWKTKQLPGGEYEWSSPIGRRYRDAPVSRARFMPSARSARESQRARGPSGDPARLSEQRLD